MNRFKVTLAISYGSDRRKLVTDDSVNLSAGGVFVETSSVLPAGTPLFVEFALPGMSRSISCKAKVAWVNEPGRLNSQKLPPGMGLQFFGLTLAQMEELKVFLGTSDLTAS